MKILSNIIFAEVSMYEEFMQIVKSTPSQAQFQWKIERVVKRPFTQKAINMA